MTTGGTGAHRVDVPSAAGEYPVLIARGLRHELGALVRRHAPQVRGWAVIADSNVGPRYGAEALAALQAEGVALGLHVFPAGERHKNRETWARLTDELLASGMARDGGVVAVGGGVTGDLAGFVAATFMRGVPVVQVPTSVVAMVDSAVGGKTGVDTGAGKNLVGSFHPPRLVVVDPETVATLAREERAQGWAEAVKHGAILDEAYLTSLEAEVAGLLEGAPSPTLAAVVRSIEIKAEVVGRDEREGGLREILNFGHTLGHALEAHSGYALPHGSAVSVGMVLEARLGESLGVTRMGSADRLVAVLRRFGLPTAPAAAADLDAILERTARDKKVRGGIARYVLLEQPGRVRSGPEWAHSLPPDRVRAALIPNWTEAEVQP